MPIRRMAVTGCAAHRRPRSRSSGERSSQPHIGDIVMLIPLVRSRRQRRILPSLVLLCPFLRADAAARAAAPSFIAFESGPVRPIALSPDRTRLFVANTPNNTLEIFDIKAD